MVPSFDLQSSIAWSAVTVLLVMANWRLVTALWPQDDLYRKTLHTLIMCWASIVAVAVSLGTAHFLTGSLLLSAVALEAFGLLAMARLLSSPSRRENAAATAHSAAAAGSDGDKDTKVELAEAVLWLFLLTFWACHMVQNGLLAFPTDFDTLWYHLPLIDYWMQERSLYAPNSWHWFTPGNNELLGLWCIAPFSGDFLATLSNLPAVLVLALASRELASLLGLGRVPSFLCAAAVTANYVILKQLTDVENDVAVAALVTSSTVYALRHARSGRRAELVLAGVSLGLLAGIKYYAIGYAGLVWFGLVCTIIACNGFRAGATAGLTAAALALSLGGYWYIRNWFLTGSPLYPKGLFTVNDELAECYPDMWKSSFIGNRSPELLSLSVQAIGKITGPLHLIAFYASPVVISWLLISGLVFWRTPSGRTQRIARLLIGYLTIGSGLILICTPFAVEDQPGTLNQLHMGYCPVRYGLAFLSLIVIGFTLSLFALMKVIYLGLMSWGRRAPAALLRQMSEESVRQPGGFTYRLQIAVPCLLLAVLSAYQLKHCASEFREELFDSSLIAVDVTLIAAIVSLLGLTNVSFCRHFSCRRLFTAPVLGIVFITGMAILVPILSQQWHRGFAQFYDSRLERGLFTGFATLGRPSETICVLDFRLYPFFGSRRQHYVCQPHKPRSASEFYDYLRTRNVTLVIALSGADLRRYGCEKCQSYLEANPRLFSRVGDPFMPYIKFHVKPPGDRRFRSASGEFECLAGGE